MKRWTLTFLIMTSLGLTSCVHREFDWEMERTYLDVVFDWMNEPDAHPQSMSLYLYGSSYSGPRRFDFRGRDGGTIGIQEGTYDAICLNNDSWGLAFRGGDTHGTFVVTTQERETISFGTSIEVRSDDLPRAEGTETQPIVCEPPLIWGASCAGHRIDFTSDGVRTTRQELRMYPSRLVDTYEISVRNIQNIGALKTMSATVSDMSDGYAPGQGKPTTVPVTLALDLNIEPQANEAQGRFLTFGHCPDTHRTHHMILYAILTDDSKYYFKFDVTGQVHSQPDSDGIYHIIIDNLKIPDPGGGENHGVGGLEPTVREWDAENITLTL